MTARPHPALLVFGVFGAPLAWVLQLIAGYGVEEAACGTGTAGDDLWGVDVLAATAFVCLVALTFAVLSLGAALRSRRRVIARVDARGLASFAALVGVAASVYFLALIALTTAGVLTLEPCRGS